MNEINNYYDGYWSEQDDVSENDPTTKIREMQLIVDIKKYKPSRILDLGCGSGRFTGLISKEFTDIKVIGADVSRVALEKARRNLTGLDFIHLDGTGKLTLADGDVDMVWNTEVIEHVLDTGMFLREVNRVLKPGGIYIGTTPYHGIFKNILICLLKFSEHFNPEKSHIRFYDKRGLLKVMEKSGFEAVNLHGIGRLPYLYRSWYFVFRKTSSPLIRTGGHL